MRIPELEARPLVRPSYCITAHEMSGETDISQPHPGVTFAVTREGAAGSVAGSDDQVVTNVPTGTVSRAPESTGVRVTAGVPTPGLLALLAGWNPSESWQTGRSHGDAPSGEAPSEVGSGAGRYGSDLRGWHPAWVRDVPTASAATMKDPRSASLGAEQGPFCGLVAVDAQEDPPSWRDSDVTPGAAHVGSSDEGGYADRSDHVRPALTGTSAPASLRSAIDAVIAEQGWSKVTSLSLT